MSASTTTASLPYREPGIVTILIISSFLLVLNAVNYILDRLVYCGLVGQIFVGIAWGAPGADWLSAEVQQAVVQLGYLGLILIVYEGASISLNIMFSADVNAGGLSSDLKALNANLSLSLAVALTGIAAPVGLSFVLLGLLPISPVQAFAAGAALCSTSLGTIFTVLSTSGLTESRLGVVLTSAALIDDVVGLIMVQIISSLGAGSAFNEVTVLRPVFVSVAFAILTPLICIFLAKPLMQHASDRLAVTENANIRRVLRSSEAAFVYQTGILLAMVTGATYAGTSNLFAAYLAGASVTWLGDGVSTHRPGSQVPASHTLSQPSNQDARADTHSSGREAALDHSMSNTRADLHDYSGRKMYEKYYSPAVNCILRPFFFASIGFAIPITRMFTGRVVWRGLVYTLLMIFGKMICGLWLIRFAPMPRAKSISRMLPSIKLSSFGIRRSTRRNSAKSSENPTPNTPNTSRKRTPLPRPKSLYPATILGSAMISRGEIGFLISSVASSSGVFNQENSNEEFLVVTWAILLCTLIGPVAVGLLVKRVKRLQEAERGKGNGLEDPLGVWGVLSSGGA